jgi:hypothetical protein
MGAHPATKLAMAAIKSRVADLGKGMNAMMTPLCF